MRIVAALVVALLALTLAGCGGTPQEAGSPTVSTPAPAASGAGAVVLEDRSAIEDAVPQPFPSFETTVLPPVLDQKLKAKRPMLLFFYDGMQEQTKPIRAEVDAVMREYRGLIDLVTFDVGTGKAGEPSAAAQASAALADGLRVKSTPYIIIVNGDGTITWRWLGYVDREIIGREVLSATE